MDSVRKIARDYIIKPSDDKEGNGACKKLDTILSKEQQKRSQKENEWRLIVAFLEGDQWLRINRRTKRLDRDRDPSEEAPWRVKMVSNQLIGIYQTLLSRMTQNDPVPEAIPATGDPADVKSAQLAEVLIRYLHDQLDLDDKLVEAVGYALVGQGYWEVYWDAASRTAINYIVHPSEVDADGEPVLLPAGGPDAESLKATADAEGIELQEETVYEGEIGVEVLSPFELYLLGGKTPQEAHSAIKVKGYTKDYIEDRWGEEAVKDLKPDGKADIELDTDYKRAEEEKSELIIIKQLYVKPSNTFEEGMYKVWAQGKVIYQSEFPYEHGELPFAKFGGVRIPGATYDSSLLFQLIPLQKELNKTISQIIEYKNLTLRPQIVSPVNALRTRPTSKPGQVIEYEWRPGMPPPDWRELNNIPQYVFTHIDQILQRINDVSGQHEASQGRTPGNVRSGDMLQLLLERDDSRMSLMIKDMERAMSRAYRLMLQLAQQFYTEARTLEVRGAAGILETKVFESADLKGAKDIRLSPGSMIPKSKAFEVDELRMLLDAGHISPQQYLQMSEFGGSAELAAQWEADRRKQQREIDAVKRNEPIAPPADFDDHGAHLDVIDLYMKSIEFESLPDDQKELLMEHRNGHSDAIAQAQESALAENIRASIAGQLRGDMTPSIIAAILSKAGVNIDPEVVGQEIEEQKELDQQHREDSLAVKSQLKIKEEEVKSLLGEERSEDDFERKELEKDFDEDRAKFSSSNNEDSEENGEDNEMSMPDGMQVPKGMQMPEGMSVPESGGLIEGSPQLTPQEMEAIQASDMTPNEMAAMQQIEADQGMPPEMSPEDMAAMEGQGIAPEIIPGESNFDANVMPQDIAPEMSPEDMAAMEGQGIAPEMTPEDMAAMEQIEADQGMASEMTPEDMAAMEQQNIAPEMSPEDMAALDAQQAMGPEMTPEDIAAMEAALEQQRPKKKRRRRRRGRG
jgi:hypothetical protein